MFPHVDNRTCLDDGKMTPFLERHILAIAMKLCNAQAWHPTFFKWPKTPISMGFQLVRGNIHCKNSIVIYHILEGGVAILGLGEGLGVN
jgi:hypothetical protein